MSTATRIRTARSPTVRLSGDRATCEWELDSNIRSLVGSPHGTSGRCRNMIQDTVGPHRYARHPRRQRLATRLALIADTVVAGFVVVGGVAHAGAPNPGNRVVVHSGQTLWGIVESHYPGTSVEQAVS